MATATKVLLADDDNDDREIFLEALASIDANVLYEGVEDGEEVIEVLTKDANRPNIIFLDINMPVMNGWDVLKKIKSDDQFNDIPIIMYSTSSGEREKRTAFDLGALCFVTKPDSTRLIKAMLEIVLAKLKENEVSPQMCREIQKLLRQV